MLFNFSLAPEKIALISENLLVTFKSLKEFNFFQIYYFKCNFASNQHSQKEEEMAIMIMNIAVNQILHVHLTWLTSNFSLRFEILLKSTILQHRWRKGFVIQVAICVVNHTASILWRAMIYILPGCLDILFFDFDRYIYYNLI